MKTTFLGIVLLFTLALTAQAQKYPCGFSAKLSFSSGVTVDPVTYRLDRHDFLAMVAATDGRSLNSRTLTLVFDVQARQFQVVQKSDGSLVTVVYTLTNEQQLPLENGDVLGVAVDALEQASLLEPGTAATAGTIAGPYVDSYIDVYPTQNVYRFVTWKADFSVLSQTGGVFSVATLGYIAGQNPPIQYAHEPVLIQGQFKVNGLSFVSKGG